VIAEALDEPVPPSLRRAKGWVGRLLESWLGADAGTRSAPDFTELDIELKSIPVSSDGRPLETTYVCTLSVDDLDTTWVTSRVRGKLRRVLWVPVEGNRALAPGDRRVGQAVLWSPSRRESDLLRRDWEEHMALVAAGHAADISASYGVVLQIRPKARHSRKRGRGLDVGGQLAAIPPRGFYLRRAFTEAILARHFAAAAR